MMKKNYKAPEVEVMEIYVEQGFAASSTIENPEEVDDSGNYWS